MLWSTFGSAVDLICQWLISVVIVRITASFSDAGSYALATSIYGIVHPIAQYKMYTYHLSDVKGELRCGEYLSFNFLTCGLAFLVCLIYSLFTTTLSSLSTILLYALYRLIKVTIDVLHAENQRNGRMDYIGISLALQGCFSLTGFSLLYLFTKSLLLALFGMSASVLAVGLFYDRRRTTSLASINLGISLGKAKKLALQCLPVVLGGIACSLSPAIPKQLLQQFNGDAALGVYASVSAPVAIIQMGANYIYYPLLGYFANYFSNGETRRFNKLLVAVTIGIAGCGVVCVAALNLVGPALLEILFGNEIVDYSYLLAPVIVCSLTTAYMWFLTDLLVSVRGLNLTVAGNALGLVAILVSSYPLIDNYGMNGVSYAMLVSYAISTLFLLIGLLRLVNKRKGTSEI